MVIEVHTGGRPGKPRLLLLVTAAFLLVTLGLAFWQADHAGALGERQAVPGTPLTVRVPRTWVADADNPQVFYLPVDEDMADRRLFQYERRVQIEYHREGIFLPFEQWLQQLPGNASRALIEDYPEPVGRLPGVQFRFFEERVWNRRAYRTETLLRVACLPRGDQVHVYYEPLGSLRPADYEIMDQVCASLEFTDPAVLQPPEQSLADAGVSLELDPDWVVTPPQLDPVEGVYIGGTQDGYPTWAIGLLPSWRVNDRTPTDLLTDLSADVWRRYDAPPRLRETTRGDGMSITWAFHPEPDLTSLPAAAVITRGPAETLLLFVYTSSNHLEGALTIAEQIATEVEYEPVHAADELDTAWRNGLRLAETLTEGGLVGRWGREPVTAHYLGTTPGGRDLAIIHHEARNRDPADGYIGRYQHWRNLPRHLAPGEIFQVKGRRMPEYDERWQIDDRAQRYQREVRLEDARPPVTIREQRGSGNTVARVLQPDGRPPIQHSWKPSRAFVPPPTEDCVTGWVARGEATVALVEITHMWGPASATVLIRNLPADDRFPRALWQYDYWPAGVIRAFDDDEGTLQYERRSASDFERIRPQ